MPTTTTPAIASAAANAAAAPTPAAVVRGNSGAQQVAACFGECCPYRGHCSGYSSVEAHGQERFIATCRTPEGGYPLFEAVAVAPLPARAAAVDSEGGETD